MNDNHIKIGEFKKNNSEIVRVSVQEYKGAIFLDCRVYFQHDNGKILPTRKGIALTKDSIDPLINLLSEGKEKL